MYDDSRFVETLWIILASTGTEIGLGAVRMKRVLQPELMRGRIADRAAMVLFLVLLTVLCVAVIRGVHTLPS
jgi:hypothetical protein